MPLRNFRELLDALPPDRRQRIESRFQASLAAMPIDERRKAREMTQPQLGLQETEDISLSALVDYVEALGGHLEIRAVFPDREIRISPFERPNR